VAVVPARDRAGTIAGTVGALRSVADVSRVLVVDDGSADDTGAVARAAGADVLSLEHPVGKGGAVRAAVDATPDADVYLVVDGGSGSTASLADRLLDPIREDLADVVLGVQPAGDRRPRLSERMARRGMRRACGWSPTAPPSGDAAVRAAHLRDLPAADRSGFEVALSVDAVRAGARVVEVVVPDEPAGAGARPAVHGRDVVRSLWPRVTTHRTRVVLSVGLAVVVLAAMLGTAQLVKLTGIPPTEHAQKVVVFGIPHLGLDDLSSGDVPTLDRLVDRGALAAASVRTYSTRPSTVEAYATLSAGTRVRSSGASADAFGLSTPVEGSTAAQVTARRSGVKPSGTIVLPGGPSAIDDAGDDVSSTPGALGTALAQHGMTTAVVGNADRLSSTGERIIDRPAAIGAMHDDSSVDTGSVATDLVRKDPAAPFGMRVDRARFVTAARNAIDRADLTILDPGETDRAASYSHLAGAAQARNLRREALRETDRILGSVVDHLPPRTLLLVVGMTPPTRSWQLTPVVAYGAGVIRGQLHSQSTKRPDLVTITDVSTTILDALDVPAPGGMIGQPFEYRHGQVSQARLQQANDVAAGRERIYFPMALTFIIVQAVFYILAIVALALSAAPRRSLAFLRIAVLTFASWPLATYIVRMWPWLMTLGGVTHLLVWVLAALMAFGASRVRGHPLAPLGVITGATVALLLADVSTGARLQAASVLGYSPHTAARFYGFGNTAYAVLAACALITAILHVDRAPRRNEALLAVTLFLGIVVVADGAPWLGSDLGGILSLVPVFGLTVLVLSGRRISARAVAIALAGTILVLGLAVGADILRPAASRTHLANFVLHSRQGDTFWTTLSRKWATNQRVFRQSIWTWMIPIIAVFTGYVLVVARGWKKLLPHGSPLRAGVIGVLAAGVVGWLVNDSGIVVTALVFVYLGAYLTLLAIEDRSARIRAET
jgi:hypothetical protein